MAARAAALLLVLAGGCGDDLEPSLPPALVAGDLVVETDPLRLVLDAPGGFTAERFLEIALVPGGPDDRFIDPRDVDPAAYEWTVPSRAVGWDAASETLEVEGGARISLHGGQEAAALEVDASAVDGAVLVRLVLPLDAGEPIYGFGERFTSADASGQVSEMQLRIDLDSESSTNETHVPVPLALWPARGAGLFVEDRRPGAFDAGAARPGALLATFALSEPGPLVAHLYAAREPLDLVRRYVALTAPPALPPEWAFAPMQWRNVNESSDELLDDARRMRELDIPGSCMWIDNPWQTGYNTFVVDEERFAGAAAMLAEVAALGYRVIVWSTPYVNRSGPTAADWDEASAAGYLVADADGRPFPFPWANGPGGMVDFTAPGATAWWQERIARALERGVSGFKLDYGEELVPELLGRVSPWRLAAGSAQTLHAEYARHYHQAYLDALGEGGFLITRAGTYGDQAVNTAVWPGDLDSDFSRHGVDNGEGKRNVGGLPAAIAATLSLSVSGYPFFGSDIGGYREGPPTTEVLLRWAEAASVGTIMQLGGGGRSHNPWDETLFDPIAVDIYRTYARLHMALFPYLIGLARAAAADGTPVVRPTRFLHPSAASDEASFLVGDALFAAPVVEPGASERTVVLPPGRWIDWWTGEASEGDGARAVTVPAPLERLPLWRRSNTFVPLLARDADTLEPASAPGVTSYADPAFGGELRLLITPEIAPAWIELHDGGRVTASPEADAWFVTLGAGDRYSVMTLDVDGRAAEIAAVRDPSSVTADDEDLPAAADPAALDSCPAPGCFLWQEAESRLRIRVHLGGGERSIAVRP